MNLLEKRRNRTAFAKAKAQAGDDGVVCGYHDEDGVPHYFAAPRDASEEELRRRAFEARNGRPMSKGEELLDAALSGDLIRAYEQVMTNYLGRDPNASD